MSQSIGNAGLPVAGQGLAGLRSGSEENERQAQGQHAAWLLQMEKALLAANPFSMEKEQEAPEGRRRSAGRQEPSLQQMPGALVQAQPGQATTAGIEEGELSSGITTAAAAQADATPAAKLQTMVNSGQESAVQVLPGSANLMLNPGQTALNAQPFWQNPQAATLLHETLVPPSPALQAASAVAPARLQLGPVPGLPHMPAGAGEVELAYAEQAQQAGMQNEAESSEPWPLRHLHVYPGQDGVQAWVRDTTLDPLQVQVLLAQMQQQMQGQGLQLKSLTVNGVKVKAAHEAGAVEANEGAEAAAGNGVEPGLSNPARTASAAETSTQGQALQVN